jgi:hypothetical protein
LFIYNKVLLLYIKRRRGKEENRERETERGEEGN